MEIKDYKLALHSDIQAQELQAVKALSSIVTSEAVDALLEGLEGDAYGAIAQETFSAIVSALTHLDKERLTNKLCNMYRKLSAMHAKKPAIIRALGNLGGTEAISILREALSDKDSNIVWHAKDALKKLGQAQ